MSWHLPGRLPPLGASVLLAALGLGLCACSGGLPGPEGHEASHGGHPSHAGHGTGTHAPRTDPEPAPCPDGCPDCDQPAKLLAPAHPGAFARSGSPAPGAAADRRAPLGVSVRRGLPPPVTRGSPPSGDPVSARVLLRI